MQINRLLFLTKKLTKEFLTKSNVNNVLINFEERIEINMSYFCVIFVIDRDHLIHEMPSRLRIYLFSSSDFLFKPSFLDTCLLNGTNNKVVFQLDFFYHHR